MRDLPQGATGVNYAGVSYRFAGGVWYEPQGPAYIVVAPPIGVIVPQLPAFATGFDVAGTNYLYANDVFYRARPDLGGYEVVNDPQDEVAEHSQAPDAPAPTRVAAAVPAVAVTPSAVAAPPVVAAPAGAVAPPAAAAPAVAVAPPAAPVPAQAAMPAVAPPPPQPPVQPQAAAATTSTGAPSTPPGNPTAIAIQPRNGQSADQEASDRYECYRFAVAQSGFDPLATSSGSPPAEPAKQEYSRAQTACLEGRGYGIQ